MVKCYLSSIMGDKKLKVSEISRDTGINKNTLHRLYNETATRVDLEMVEQLCRYLNIGMNDLFEIIDED
jgi:putative transcriptional regulator